MASYDDYMCRCCGNRVTRLDDYCPFCHTKRRDLPLFWNGVAVVLGIALGAWILLLQIDKTTGSDHLGAIRDFFLP